MRVMVMVIVIVIVMVMVTMMVMLAMIKVFVVCCLERTVLASFSVRIQNLAKFNRRFRHANPDECVAL